MDSIPKMIAKSATMLVLLLAGLMPCLTLLLCLLSCTLAPWAYTVNYTACKSHVCCIPPFLTMVQLTLLSCKSLLRHAAAVAITKLPMTKLGRVTILHGQSRLPTVSPPPPPPPSFPSRHRFETAVPTMDHVQNSSLIVEHTSPFLGSLRLVGKHKTLQEHSARMRFLGSAVGPS